MKLIALIVGVILVLLGGLWMLQWLGIVTIAPVMCVAECTALSGPSIVWAGIGLLTIVAGGALIAYGRGRKPPV